MSKVVLSKGYEFDLVANGVNAGSDTVVVTIKPGDYTLEQLETIWTGNDNIKVVLDEGSEAGETIANYSGYTAVNTLVKNNKYEAEVTDPEEEVTYITVVSITCAKPALDKRVSDVEDAVDDIINTILG